jgi:adenine deaminase
MPIPKNPACHALAKVALGEAEADLAIVNGTLVNVYTAELLRNQQVLIQGDRIAYVGGQAGKSIGPRTHVIDAAGKFLIPGLIDGHTHMDYLYATDELSQHALKSGTTSIITEAAEIAFRVGYRGICEYLKSTHRQPVKYWFTIPPMGTISPVASTHLLSPAEIKRLLRRADCVGLGEIYWSAANAGDPRLLSIMQETLRAGKKLEGHSAGAAAHKLQAYTSFGISSDHEPITPQETLERLRLGLTVMIREGEVRQDLAGVAGIKDADIDFRRLALATDGIGPLHLVKYGFMDSLVQKAIDLGFPPLRAIQMASLNVAEHYNLQDVIGGIAPGRIADILIIPALDRIDPEWVISSGQIGVDNHQMVKRTRARRGPHYFQTVMQIPHTFTAPDFKVKLDTTARSARVRAISQLTSVLTRESLLDLPVAGGEIKMDPARDVLKVAMVEYVHTGGKTFTGFIHGLGLKKGAVAASTCWDCGDLAVVGADEEDMALAVNRIRELGGAAVVCSQGKVLAEVPFPICGIISAAPIAILAEKLAEFQSAAAGLGCVSPDIRTTLSVLATPAIPYLRICESGLFDVRLNKAVDLVV